MIWPIKNSAKSSFREKYGKGLDLNSVLMKVKDIGFFRLSCVFFTVISFVCTILFTNVAY